MALRTPDLIRQLSTTTGTGAYTLGAALPGFRDVASVLTSGDTMYYRAMMGTDWEIGKGTWNGATFARTSVLLSTNGNSAVNWGAGNKVFFSVVPEDLINLFFLTDGSREITGNVSIHRNSPSFILNSDVATNRMIGTQTAGVPRISLFLGTGAESGSNSGSNILGQRFDDAGNSLGTWLAVTRATGEWGIGGAARAGSALTVRTLVNSDAEGVFVQNQDNSADSAMDIKFAGVSATLRGRIKSGREASSQRGYLQLSVYNSGTEVPVAYFSTDGNMYKQSSGAKFDAFESGTRLVFQQSTAPLGWTKDTTLNDRALRVVSGSVTNGGGAGFSSLFASRTPTGYVDYHALTVDEMPSHSHEWTSLPGAVVTTAAGSGNIASGMGGALQIPYTNFALNSKGGNAGHNHPLVLNAMDFSVAYTDTVVCQKD